MNAAKSVGPCSFVIFGASGDLMRRLLILALYNLAAAPFLPEAFATRASSQGELLWLVDRGAAPEHHYVS
jgi:glucose-6-phosphate 1-dehydrogenase